MFRWFRPILTQQPQVSMITIVAINLLWFCNMFQMFITSNGLAFTVKHFTDDTRLIALATSIGFGFSFLIGPVCNYLSDRIWTKLGRRRPFVILGWTAVAIAMAILPLMPSYGALVTLIVVYTLIGDMGTPVEPLCMEVVPPHQRARSMSTRLILIQAASLIYFQLLFPRFDQLLHIPDSIPLIGGLAFTGERLIYTITSLLFFSMVGFLLFVVREVKVPSAPNIPLRELKFTPVKSTWAFLVDTFGDRRWLWIYLLYCSANAFFASWTNSPLYALLLTEQFGFTKADMGLMILPSQLIGAIMLLPLMGWFGDRYPRIPYWLLLAIGGAAAAAVIWIMTGSLNLPRDQLPGIFWMLVLGGLMMTVAASFYLVAVQIVLAWSGKEGARVYIFLVSLGLEIVQCGGSWLLIRHYQNAGIAPPILIWFLYDLIRLTIQRSMEVVTTPMFFDFVPRDRMGTLSSGFGFTNGLLVFTLTNVVGTWIQLLSGTGVKNYGSGFLLQGAVGVLAFIGTVMFIRSFRRGKIFEYGRLGFGAEERPVASPAVVEAVQ
jgi:hypothetical protein